MIRIEQNGYRKPIYILYPGDYHATKEDAILSTVTGSCAVVCLYDNVRRISGMRHLVIPGANGTGGILRNKIYDHGIAGMELLLGEIVKLGGNRKNLVAKIFGAGYMTGTNADFNDFSNSTMTFLHEYFGIEKIPIVNDDLGGDYRRKIYFFTNAGKTYRKILVNNEGSSEFINMEYNYIDRVFRQKQEYGRVMIFN